MKYEKGKCYKLLVGIKREGEPFKHSGKHVVVECEDSSDDVLKGVVIGLSHESEFFQKAIQVGCSMNHKNHDDVWLVAESREMYFSNPANVPVKIIEKVVEKEVVKEVEKIVRVEAFDETFIDKLYNWYCRQMKRNDELV